MHVDFVNMQRIFFYSNMVCLDNLPLLLEHGERKATNGTNESNNLIKQYFNSLSGQFFV